MKKAMKTKTRGGKKARKPIKYFQARCGNTNEPIGLPKDTALEALEEAFNCGYKAFRKNARGEWVEAVYVEVVR
jgi:hypothetical protein